MYVFVSQTMYDKTRGGEHLRTRIVCVLATWHTYKAAAYKVFKKYSGDVFAPLFHRLFPSNIFFAKPSYFTSLLSMFQYLRIAYPMVESDMKSALATDLNPNMQNHLLNLRALCTFFIPVVTIYLSYVCNCVLLKYFMYSFVSIRSMITLTLYSM